jgi:H2-forming N5,N10-methylenetetrahydromethanopterin dehydrogenase-like enzyme
MTQLQAKMVALQKAINDEQLDRNIDSAKSHYEEAREQLKLALRIMQEQLEQATQAAKKISQ